MLAAILPFVLAMLGPYIVSDHTRDGRLAVWVIIHSQTMTDQQLWHSSMFWLAILALKSVQVVIIILI